MRSQRHRRYRDGIDSAGVTAYSRGEPSMRSQTYQRAEAIKFAGNVNPPAANAVAPAVTGTPTVGQILTTTTGTWVGQGVITYTFQWFQEGVYIVGGNATTLTIPAGSVGLRIRSRVTATDGYGVNSVYSLFTAAVAP